jgi:Mor family transcriptional regulator
MKDSLKHHLKSVIIVAILDLIDSDNSDKKKEVIEKLSEYAKEFKIPLRRKATVSNVKKHLREFILNREGYIVTIPNLFNSLTNI